MSPIFKKTMLLSRKKKTLNSKATLVIQNFREMLETKITKF